MTPPHLQTPTSCPSVQPLSPHHQASLEYLQESAITRDATSCPCVQQDVAYYILRRCRFTSERPCSACRSQPGQPLAEMLQTSWACASRILVPLLLLMLVGPWVLFSREPAAGALLSTSSQLPEKVSHLAASFSRASGLTASIGKGWVVVEHLNLDTLHSAHPWLNSQCNEVQEPNPVLCLKGSMSGPSFLRTALLVHEQGWQSRQSLNLANPSTSRALQVYLALSCSSSNQMLFSRPGHDKHIDH